MPLPIFKNAERPVGFYLDSHTVKYAAPAPLSVPGIVAAEIEADAKAAGEPVMIKPMTGNKVTLMVETSAATFDNVVATIQDDERFKEGKAYAITLTFKQQAVGLSATVDEWTEGSGSAEVE